MIAIPHYFYETSVLYPDIGEDRLLSHKGLLRMLQETAARASDECGYGLKDIHAKSLFWILTGWRTELLERVCWRAPITVETWPRTMDGFTSDRDFIVRSGDTVVARATSRWFLINAHTGRIARATPELKAAYDMDPTALFDDPPPSGGKPLENASLAFSTTIGRRDIDTNHHVNNISYLDYALEALPSDVFEHPPSTLEIAYRKQILLGTAIQCFYGKTDDGKHQVEIRSEDDGKAVHHAYIWLY